jgi:hypothetical protein
MLVQPLRAATECEVDLVRKRPDHGNLFADILRLITELRPPPATASA